MICAISYGMWQLRYRAVREGTDPRDLCVIDNGSPATSQRIITDMNRIMTDLFQAIGCNGHDLGRGY